MAKVTGLQLLQVFIEEEQAQGSIISTQDLLQIDGVTGEVADRLGLLVHKLLLQERSYFRIVKVLTLVADFLVDAERLPCQFFFDVERLGQALYFVQFQIHVLVGWLGHDEFYVTAPLGDFLYEFYCVVPGGIGQTAVQFFKSLAVRLVVAEICGHEKEVVGVDHVRRHVCLKRACNLVYGSVFSVAVRKNTFLKTKKNTSIGRSTVFILLGRCITWTLMLKLLKLSCSLVAPNFKTLRENIVRMQIYLLTQMLVVLT